MTSNLRCTLLLTAALTAGLAACGSHLTVDTTPTGGVPAATSQAPSPRTWAASARLSCRPGAPAESELSGPPTSQQVLTTMASSES